MNIEELEGANPAQDLLCRANVVVRFFHWEVGELITFITRYRRNVGNGLRFANVFQ